MKLKILIVLNAISLLVQTLSSGKTAEDVKREFFGDNFGNYNDPDNAMKNIMVQSRIGKNNALNATASAPSSTYNDPLEIDNNGINPAEQASNTPEIKYSYDYRGRRIAVDKTEIGGKYHTYSYSGGNVVAEYEADTKNGEQQLIRLYYRGPDMGGGVGGINYSTDANGNNPEY